MKKKGWMSLLLAGAMAVGCSVPSYAEEVETVTMLTYVDWYGDGLHAVEDYINEHAEELGFRLEVQQVAGGNEGDELISARTATNDLPDLLNIYSVLRYSNSFGGKGKLLPVDDLECVSEYDPAMLGDAYYTEDGTLYGLPYGTGYYYGFYYNKKVLEAAGIEEYPETWEEFLAACEAIKQTGVTPVYYSAADSWTIQIMALTGYHADYEARNMTSSEFWEAVNSNQIHFEDLEYVWDAAAKAKELIDSGYVQDTYLSDTYDMAQTALANGECGFYPCAHVVVSEIASKYPDAVEDIGGNIIPLYDKDHNLLDTAFPTMLSVTTAAKNPELAKKALNFMCSAEGMQIYAEAQPGVYFNKKINVETSPAIEEQAERTPINIASPKYEANIIGTYLTDYFVGGIELEDIPKGMDDAFARSAEAVGDENWVK